jgi:hypothetical protein
MEGYVAKNGIPKFAMDDVEIVLDELCSGYDNATECRMRKELFDHYQSAFDDAVGDGWIEEVTHKKVLQDLGWETTLMVGRVCRELGYTTRMQAHAILYGKNMNPKRGIALFSLFSLYYVVRLFGDIADEKWIHARIEIALLCLCVYFIFYMVYHCCPKQPILSYSSTVS